MRTNSPAVLEDKLPAEARVPSARRPLEADDVQAGASRGRRAPSQGGLSGGSKGLVERQRMARARSPRRAPAQTAASASSGAEDAPQGPRRGESLAIQIGMWGAGFILFSFGDTLTSLLVFGSGGREANVLLGTVLKIFGGSIWAFLIIKALATVTVVLISRRQPGIERVAPWAMVGLGLFLVGQNATILLLRS